MASEPIPSDVRRLVAACLPSVPHLEALVLAHATPEHAWSAREFSDRLYVPIETAQAILSELVACRLLEAAGAEGELAKFAQGEARDAVASLAGLYARRVVEITRLIHSRDAGAAQRLADAFRLPRRRE